MSWTAQKINNLFNPPSPPVVGRFRAQNHTGGAVLGDTGREGGRVGGREAGGRTKVGVRGLEGRKLGGREGGGREGM